MPELFLFYRLIIPHVLELPFVTILPEWGMASFRKDISRVFPLLPDGRTPPGLLFKAIQ